MTKNNETHFCTELEWINRAESFNTAIEENADNIITELPQYIIENALLHINAPSIALIFQKKWKSGRTLKIAFIGNTDETIKQKIISYAKLWLPHMNLKFNFVSGTSGDIRVSTVSGGSWSYLGTDAKLIASNKGTMNYGWLSPNTPDEEYSRIVLHEFGHALSAIHEHQHPATGIPWDKPKVYEYYAQFGWDKKKVDHNIFRKYSSSQLNTSSYDQNSIMHYAVPNNLTVGDWEVGWNRELSEIDKKFMRRQYAYYASGDFRR